MSTADATGGLPDWVVAAIVIASIAVALLTVLAMFRRVRQPDAGAAPAGRHYPERYRDPVLVISALGIVALALAVWWLR